MTIFVAAAPNGARLSRADHINIPITDAEIGAEADACRRAGAVMVHVHARDAAGRHSLAPVRLAAMLDCVGSIVGNGVDIQMTTEAAGIYRPEQQWESLAKVRPSSASLAIREIAPGALDKAELPNRLSQIYAHGTSLQFILYNRADVEDLQRVFHSPLLGDIRPSVLLVCGRDRSPPRGEPADLVLLETIPAEWRRMVCGFGPGEQALLVAAAAAGADVRVGFENNLFDETGKLAASTSAQVASLIAALKASGHRIGTIAEWPSRQRGDQ
jgi:uncharacterized protein (DUF849 family)